MTQKSPKHSCVNCGVPVKESKAFVERLIYDVSICNKCGGRLTPQVYVSEDDIIDHLIRLDNATLMVYDDPGLSIAACNLQDIGRAIFTIYYQRGYIACADLHHQPKALYRIRTNT